VVVAEEIAGSPAAAATVELNICKGRPRLTLINDAEIKSEMNRLLDRFLRATPRITFTSLYRSNQ
jgi:hypothetical protein